MGVWEFLNLLVDEKSKPVVSSGRSDRVFWTVSLVLVLFQSGVGLIFNSLLHDFSLFLCVQFTLFCIMAPGVVLLLTKSQGLNNDHLEQFWQEDLPKNQVLVVLTRPLLTRLSLVIVLSIFGFSFLFSNRGVGSYDLLSLYLAYPLCGYLVGSAVFTRKWLSQPSKRLHSFNMGILEASLCVFAALLISWPLYLFGKQFVRTANQDFFFSVFLSIPPLIFSWLKWGETLRDAPERLFRHFDEGAFLELNWIANEKYHWAKITPSRRQRLTRLGSAQFFSKESLSNTCIFSCLCIATAFIGYISCPEYALGGDDSTVMAIMGAFKGVFGYSALMGYSLMVPLVLMGGVKRRKNSKCSTFVRGSLFSSLFRLSRYMAVFFLATAVLGELLARLFLGHSYILSDGSSLISFLFFLAFLVLPVSIGSILFLAPWSWRRTRFVVLWMLACICLWVPLLSRGGRDGGMFFYDSYWLMGVIYCVYHSVAMLLIAFGIRWLGSGAVQGSNRHTGKSLWPRVKKLYLCKDNPLVYNGGKRAKGGYAYILVAVFYLMIFGICLGVNHIGLNRFSYVLLFSLCVVSMPWSGVCLVLFAPKFYSTENLEELWLTRLSKKEVLAGLLRRPFLIGLYSFVLPYLVLVYHLLEDSRSFDEALTLFLIFPLAGLVISAAVFTRRWLLNSRATVRFFIMGTIESCFYMVMIGLLVYPIGMVISSFLSYQFTEFLMRLVLWIPPLVFVWLKWRQVLRDAPVRLFRCIDEEDYLRNNWVAREIKSWKNTRYRKKAVFQQRRFFYPGFQNMLPCLMLLLLILGCAVIIGCMHVSPNVALNVNRYRYWRGPSSEEVVLRALFGFSAYMGLSIMFPLVLVGGMVGNKKNRKVPFFPGTFIHGMTRYGLILFLFQAVWLLVGELLVGKFLSRNIFFVLFSSPERVMEFILFQLFVFFPVSCSTLLLLAPSKGRRRWSAFLWVSAFLLICLPLFSMDMTRGRQIFNYPMVRGGIFYPVYYLYLCVAVLLVSFGFDWLGARFYRLEIEEGKVKDPPDFCSIRWASFWRDSLR